MIWTEGVALAAAGLVGSFVTRVFDYATGRTRWRQDELAKVREELMQEVRDLRQEVRDLRREVDRWQAQAYQLRADGSVLKRENENLRGQVARLKAENKRLSDELRLLERRVNANTEGPDQGPSAVPGGDECQSQT